jgi:hypothetical protein
MARKPRWAVDPAGRWVVFDRLIEGHLARRRPQMLRHADAILNAINRPDFHEYDPVAGRERFYRRDLDPGRWLRVVVDFNESPAFVVTAFIQSHKPDGAP